MSGVEIYLALCCSLGIAQFAEAFSFRSRYVQISQLNGWVSLMELVWFFVSIYVLIKVELNVWATLAAVFFIFLIAVGAVYSITLVVRSDEADVTNTQVPNLGFRIYCVTACIYVILNIMAITQLW